MNLNKVSEELAKKWLRDASKNIDRVPKGQGVFKDGDFIIANPAGARFRLNGKVESIAEMMPVSDQLYLNIKGEDLAKQTLTSGEMDELNNAFRDVYGTDSESLFYMLTGFCIQGILSGISEHRAHVWLNGMTGSGKSKLKEYFIETLCKRMCLATVDATPAAIDQHLAGNDGHNAVVVTLDECGDETSTKAARVNDLITLACQLAVSQGLGSKIRGTASQDGKGYNRTAAMLFCSQTNSLKDPQDIARFLVFDISEYKLDKKKLDKLQEVTDRLSDKFMYTAIVSAEHYLKLYKPIRNHLIDTINSSIDVSHRVQALTSVIAGAAALDKVVSPKSNLTPEDYCDSVREMIDKQVEYFVSKVTEDTTVMDDLFLTPLRIDGVTMTLKELLSVDSPESQEKLWRDYGIKKNNRGNIVISLTNFKVPLLFKHYYNKKVHISKDKLINAAQHNPKISINATKVGGKSERIWRLKEE